MGKDKNKILSFFASFQNEAVIRNKKNIKKFADLPEPDIDTLKILSNLENKIAYSFKLKKLLFKALVHSSYAHENPNDAIKHNERLEYLGDSVLSLILADYLFNNFPEKREGHLSLMLSWLASESNLVNVAKSIDLGAFSFLGAGEDSSGGRNRSSLLADSLEALIGSIFLDGGFSAAQKVVINLFEPQLSTVDIDKHKINCKNKLQTFIHLRNMDNPVYIVKSETGPDHNKIFEIEVSSGDKLLGRGCGSSKKEAEMNAASRAIEYLIE